MNSREISTLLEQSSTCPSAMVLDQLHHGHLGLEEADETWQHVASCERCRERMEHRRQETMGLSEVEARRILASLKQASQQERPSDKTIEALHRAVRGAEARTRLVPLEEKGDDELSKARWRKRRNVLAGVVTLAAAAAVAFLVIGVDRSQRPDSEDDRDTVRVMGSIKLTVFRKHGEQVSEVVSGDAFHAGDQVRFQVTTPGVGHILILGVEGNGNSYLAHPTTGPEKSQPISGSNAVMLPGAMELDDSPRTEWLHLVYCSRPFTRRQLKSSKERPDQITIPKGCAKDTFEMRKKASKP